MRVYDADDFGCSHRISADCQSHDCRDKLDEFHYANQNFKITLFAIPGEMTPELVRWCQANSGWVELAVHGFYHTTNYECSEMDYQEFDDNMRFFQPMLDAAFVKGFKAPGWQISDDAFRWLDEHGWWIADQAYNNNRRPKKMAAYVNDNGRFVTTGNGFPDFVGSHHHTWDCMNNGLYEMSDQIKQDLREETEFRFVSEVLV